MYYIFLEFASRPFYQTPMKKDTLYSSLPDLITSHEIPVHRRSQSDNNVTWSQRRQNHRTQKIRSNNAPASSENFNNDRLILPRSLDPVLPSSCSTDEETYREIGSNLRRIADHFQGRQNEPNKVNYIITRIVSFLMNRPASIDLYASRCPILSF